MKLVDFKNAELHILVLSLQMAISHIMLETDNKLSKLSVPEPDEANPEKTFEESKVFLTKSSEIVDSQKEKVKELVPQFMEEVEKVTAPDIVKHIFTKTATTKIDDVIDKMDFDVKQSRARIELIESIRQDEAKLKDLEASDEAVNPSGDVPEDTTE